MRYVIKFGENENGLIVWDSNSLNSKYTVTEPILTEEVDAAGSLEFTMPYNHPCINDLSYFKPYIYLHRDESEIWRGRVTENKLDMHKSRYIYAEGDLAFLNDSQVRKSSFKNATVKEFFEYLIDSHNRQVEKSKRFIVGNISPDIAEEEIDAEVSDNTATLEVIKNVFIDGEGYHIRTRYAKRNGYVDLLKDGYGVECNQSIEFGVNLLDLAVDETTENLYTCLIPLGKTLETSSDSSGTVSGTDSGAASSLVNKAISYAPVSESYNVNGNTYKGGGKSFPIPSFAWCQYFVSICAKAVGIMLYDGKIETSTTSGMNWFKAKNSFKYKGSYIPQSGNIIYFKTNYSHVGIVMDCDGSNVYTIEGNASGGVHMRKYSLSQEHITGYGVYTAKNKVSNSSSDSKIESKSYSGKTYNARFYCYSPGEGGYYDAQGVKLKSYLDSGKYECAVPSRIPLGSKIQIHVDSGNKAFDGRVYEAHDHGDSNISVWSDGTYGIDLLVASKAEQWSGTGTITVIDGESAEISDDTEDTSGDSTQVNIINYKKIDDAEFYHGRGKDFIYYKPAVERYGRIFKTVTWTNCISPKRLITKAKKRLKARFTLSRQITMSAVDLSDIGANVDRITIGCAVTCKSAPHGIADVLSCNKIVSTLNDASQNSYTFGAVQNTITSVKVNRQPGGIENDDNKYMDTFEE